MLNTILHDHMISPAAPPQGANPFGTWLQSGDVLTVSAEPGSRILCWNLGNKNREIAANDTFTDVTSAGAIDFGPFPGPRVFRFSIIGGGSGRYQISRDE